MQNRDHVAVTRLGIVLGAGGPLGWAFHLGVFEGLTEVTGRRPQDAARIVGTSAGAAIGATALTGASTDTVLAAIAQGPNSQDREALRESMRSLRRPVRLLPAAPGALRSDGAGWLQRGLGLLPRGLLPTDVLSRFPIGDPAAPLPPALWVVAVRLEDGTRTVFGKDLIPVTRADAIEASSAIPLLFAPKVIGEHRYVDGGVHSPTSADVLLGDGRFDIVIIVSPMTRAGSGPLRRRARTVLRRELTLLEAAGVRTVLIEPDDEAVDAAAGFPRSRPDAGHDIVFEARRQTVQALEPVCELVISRPCGD